MEERLGEMRKGRRERMRIILQFISGSAKIPATGFYEVPKIYFTNVDRLPWPQHVIYRSWDS